MAKFELSIYDMTTEDVVKVYKRNLMPVSLYIKFQELSEKIIANKVESDAEMFYALQDLFLEVFPEMTKEEYLNQTDTAEVLNMYRTIIDKSTQISSGNSKNG